MGLKPGKVLGIEDLSQNVESFEFAHMWHEHVLLVFQGFCAVATEQITRGLRSHASFAVRSALASLKINLTAMRM